MDGIPGIFEMLVEDHLSVSRVNRSAFQYVHQVWAHVKGNI